MGKPSGQNLFANYATRVPRLRPQTSAVPLFFSDATDFADSARRIDGRGRQDCGDMMADRAAFVEGLTLISA
jgi:hypothetical protein